MNETGLKVGSFHTFFRRNRDDGWVYKSTALFTHQGSHYAVLVPVDKNAPQHPVLTQLGTYHEHCRCCGCTFVLDKQTAAMYAKAPDMMRDPEKPCGST